MIKPDVWGAIKIKAFNMCLTYETSIKNLQQGFTSLAELFAEE